jgi:hypothetical protein
MGRLALLLGSPTAAPPDSDTQVPRMVSALTARLSAPHLNLNGGTSTKNTPAGSPLRSSGSPLRAAASPLRTAGSGGSSPPRSTTGASTKQGSTDEGSSRIKEFRAQAYDAQQHMRQEVEPIMVSAARALTWLCNAASLETKDMSVISRDWVSTLVESACELLKHDSNAVKEAGAGLLAAMRLCWAEGAKQDGPTCMRAAMEVLLRPEERVSAVIRSCVVAMSVELRHVTYSDDDTVATEICSQELMAIMLALDPSSTHDFVTAMKAYAAADKRMRYIFGLYMLSQRVLLNHRAA